MQYGKELIKKTDKKNRYIQSNRVELEKSKNQIQTLQKDKQNLNKKKYTPKNYQNLKKIQTLQKDKQNLNQKKYTPKN